MMKMIFRHILLTLAACGLLAIAVQAQDTFHNPAFENDEFSKSLARAQMLLRSGNTDEAVKEFTHAAKLKNDQCVECFSMIGRVDLEQHKYKEAAAAFRQAAELKSSDQAEWYNFAGVSLYLSGDKAALDDAARMLNLAIDTSGGKLVQAYFNLGYTLIKAGKIEEGNAALKKFLEKSPNAPEAEGV